LATGNQYRDDHRHVPHGLSLIQNTQNRDTLALQIKLSELIVAMKGADNKLAAIDDATDEELERAHEKVKRKVAKKS
jgi:low affinity Fe/Cu permease